MWLARARLDAAFRRALEEHTALLGHLLGLLLAHGATQQVRAAERVAGQNLRDLHDLLLIEDHAVRRLQRRFEAGMQIVGRRTRAVLARDELVGHLHRPRPKQRHDGREVVEPIGLQALDQIAHAERFQLEHRRRAALPEQLVGFRVVHGNGVDVERRLAAPGALAIDRRDGLVDDRQRLQAEEVELDEADRLEIVLVELRQQRAVGIGVERHVLGDRLRRDHDAAGMRADVARETFEPLRQIDEPAHLLVVL